MSTAPNGWQDPKQNWSSADVPLPTDLNRIEGNIQAIESGSRTLDPSQAPSGNTGSLRQILDWLANRIRAITGASNWYGAPATTLAAAKSHIDAMSGIHGATSSATANRLIIRDASGRAQVAAPSASADIARKAEVDLVSSALTTHKSSGDHDGRYYTKSQLNTSGGGGAVHWNNVTSKPSIPRNPVPVTQLKKAQGSYTNPAGETYKALAVHQYAFASPSTVRVAGNRWMSVDDIGIIRDGGGSGGRLWSVGVADSTTRGTVTWDYLTASGHPRVWAEVDERGEIVSMWEAEDPADPDFPDEPPIEASKDEEGNPIPGRLVIPLRMPDEWSISAIRDRLTAPPQSEWLTKSRFAAQVEPVSIHRAMCEEQYCERGLEVPDDIRAVFADISDYDRRHWYLQLWLRQASRLLHDHRPSTHIPLYREMFRVDRRTGRLLLR